MRSKNTFFTEISCPRVIVETELIIQIQKSLAAHLSTHDGEDLERVYLGSLWL